MSKEIIPIAPGLWAVEDEETGEHEIHCSPEDICLFMGLPLCDETMQMVQDIVQKLVNEHNAVNGGPPAEIRHRSVEPWQGLDVSRETMRERFSKGFKTKDSKTDD